MCVCGSSVAGWRRRQRRRLWVHLVLHWPTRYFSLYSIFVPQSKLAVTKALQRVSQKFTYGNDASSRCLKINQFRDFVVVLLLCFIVINVAGMIVSSPAFYCFIPIWLSVVKIYWCLKDLMGIRIIGTFWIVDWGAHMWVVRIYQLEWWQSQN